MVVTGNDHKVAAFLHARSGYLGNQSLRANPVSGLSVRIHLGDLPDPGIEPASPMSPALAGGFFVPENGFKIDKICYFGFKYDLGFHPFYTSVDCMF